MSDRLVLIPDLACLSSGYGGVDADVWSLYLLCIAKELRSSSFFPSVWVVVGYVVCMRPVTGSLYRDLGRWVSGE